MKSSNKYIIFMLIVKQDKLENIKIQFMCLKLICVNSEMYLDNLFLKVLKC